MKYLNYFKNGLLYLVYLFILCLFIYFIYFINSNEPDNQNSRRVIKSILKKNTISKHIFNDYREEFLPNTQFIKLDYKKIELDFLKKNSCYFGNCYTFF